MSFQIEIKEKDLVAAEVVQLLQEGLVRAFLKRRKKDKLKQADIARKLEVDRSQVSRWLNSPRDMTLKSIGHLLWALDAELEPKVVLREDKAPATGTNLAPATAICSDNVIPITGAGKNSRVRLSPEQHSSLTVQFG